MQLKINGEKDIAELLLEAWAIPQTNKTELVDRIRDFEVLCNRSGELSLRLETNLLQARALIWEDRYMDALELVSLTYNRLLETEWAVMKARALRMFSWAYFYMGRFEESLQYCFSTLKLLKELPDPIYEGDKSIEPMLLTTIAAIYMRTDRYSEALEFQHRALEMTLLDQSNVSTTMLINLSENYLRLNEVEKALTYCEEAYGRIMSDLSDHQGHYQCHTMFGHILTYQKRYTEAEAAFHEAMGFATQIERKHFKIHVFLRMGDLYSEQELWDQAIEVLKEAYDTADVIRSDNQKQEAALKLSKVYENLQDVHLSIDYYKKYKEVSDIILSQKVQGQLNQYMIEFKVEQSKKDTEIYRLKNIELKKKTEELELAYKNVHIISEIGKEITSSLNFEDVLLKVYNHFNALMEASVLGIGLYDQETQLIDYKLFVEDGVRMAPFSLKVEEGLKYSSACILRKEAIYVPQVNRSQAIRIPGAINDDQHEVLSLIYCPLMIQDEVIGLFTVQSYQANAYNQNQFEVVKALASFIAIALNNSRKSQELEETAKTLEMLSQTDMLTGLFNRRAVMKALESEWGKFKRYHRPFSILLCDIDHFKDINDFYGHGCGDAVLKQMSNCLEREVRENDLIARWGGEEFLILLPETTGPEAEVIAQRLRQSVSQLFYVCDHCEQVQLTMTFGISEVFEEATIDELIRRADQALYQGKKQGRNCVYRMP